MAGTGRGCHGRPGEPWQGIAQGLGGKGSPLCVLERRVFDTRPRGPGSAFRVGGATRTDLRGGSKAPRDCAPVRLWFLQDRTRPRGRPGRRAAPGAGLGGKGPRFASWRSGALMYARGPEPSPRGNAERGSLTASHPGTKTPPPANGSLRRRRQRRRARPTSPPTAPSRGTEAAPCFPSVQGVPPLCFGEARF